MPQGPDFQTVAQEQSLPAVMIDHNSLFVRVNKAFESVYGWTEKDLLGKSVTEIIPAYLRDAHMIGFSRFLVTEEVTLMGKYLPLEILYKDGTIRDAMHYIIGNKKSGEWQFAATIEPR